MNNFSLISLLEPTSFSVPSNPRCYCGRTASYVLIRGAFSERSGLMLQAEWSMVRCCEHAKNESIIRTPDELRALNMRHLARLEEERSSFTRLVRKNEKKALDTKNFIPRLRGRKGILVEMRDSRLACLMLDGRTFVPCCWATGAHYIEARSSIAHANTHSPGCRNHHVSAA